MSTPLETRIGEMLRSHGWRLAVAESCTGGLVGHRITNVPGSSDYFLGGVLAYANEAKMRLLGVSAATLQTWGAVSEQTALEMARGACAALGAEVGLSVTGVAGPGGGTSEKPVGTVWVGLSVPNGEAAWHFQWAGDRLSNKEQSAQAALQALADWLERPP